MHEQSQFDLSSLIESNRSAIKSAKSKGKLSAQPGLRDEIQARKMAKVEMLCRTLEGWLDELSPFVTSLRGQVTDITEESSVCAIYMLLRSALNEWESFFLLARNGRYSSAAAILRKIGEASDQSSLFALEFGQSEYANLKKWFLGRIISNEVARKALDNVIPKEVDVDVSSLLTYLYQMHSNISHNGYVSMLESISPFTEDFDFDGPTGFHSVIGLLNAAGSYMTDFTQTLRMVYLTVVKDPISESKLDVILKKYNPDLGSKNIPDSTKDVFKRKCLANPPTMKTPKPLLQIPLDS